MKRALIYAAAVCLLSAPTVCGQTTTTLTLDECLRQAVANNTKLRTADNQVQMAAEQRKEALTKYFPTVSATGGGLIANENLIKLDLMGMEMGFVKKGLTASVTAMQPIFAGGQIVNGNRLARVGEDASRLQRNMTEDEVRLTAETYFWQILMLKEKLNTLDRVEAQLANVHKDAQAAVDAGVRNRNDLLQVQLRENEIRATRIEVENGLSVVNDLLAQYIGCMGDSIAIAYSVDIDKLPESPLSLYVSPDDAVGQTSEYKLLNCQVEASKLNRKIEVGKNLPTVAVGGAYMYHNLMEKSENRVIGMVTVSVPITGWWGGSYSIKRKKIEEQNAENDLNDKSQLLVIRMRKAWSDVNDAYKRLGIARESIEQSEENLRLNTDYYQAGTAAMSDLLDAQTLYQQSRDSYVEALTKYEVKKREYLQSTGRN